jgi:hypothetical protein
MADIVSQVEQVIEELVTMQRKRVLDHARRINPRLTDDDVQQPQDFAELAGSPEWNYEDGILAGFQSAQAALRALWKRLEDV